MSELFEVAGEAKKAADMLPQYEPLPVMREESPQVPAVQSQEDRLLEKVLDSGNIEVLERYINLRKSEQEREAQIAFEKAFSIMHAEFPEIKKTKKSHNGYYAPIEEIQRTINPIVKKHGFAYWWTSEKVDGGILEYIVISYGGYSKKSPCYIPAIQSNNVTNAAQAIGSMQSYGRRYSIIDGFGLTIVDEDDDGSLGKIGEEAAPYIEQINKWDSVESLRKTYIKALEMTAKNKAAQGLIALAKDAKQRELKNGSAQQ